MKQSQLQHFKIIIVSQYNVLLCGVLFVCLFVSLNMVLIVLILNQQTFHINLFEEKILI